MAGQQPGTGLPPAGDHPDNPPKTDPVPRDAGSGDQRPWQRPLAWVLAGGALAFAGGGVAALVVRNDKAKSYNTLVDTTGCAGADAATCSDLRSDGNVAGTLAVVGFGVAGAMAIGSAVLFATAPTAQPSGRVAFLGCGLALNRPSVTCRLAF